MHMNASAKTLIPQILKKYQEEILEEWRREQAAAAITRHRSLIKDDELREQSRDFVRLLQTASETGNLENIDAPEWTEVRDLLTAVSRSRGLQGLTPSETAMFVFSFKKPLFARIKKEVGDDAEMLAAEMWAATELIDKLGLFTTEAYQVTREEVIRRQQEEMMELSTPVVKLWDGILAL